MSRCLLAFVALALVPAFAAEPVRIDAPVTITASGSYVVTRDITARTGPAITIAAEYVDLDLAGHTVSTEDRTAVPLHVKGHLDGVVIHGGQLRAANSKPAPSAVAFGRTHGPAPATSPEPAAVAKAPARPRVAPATASLVKPAKPAEKPCP